MITSNFAIDYIEKPHISQIVNIEKTTKGLWQQEDKIYRFMSNENRNALVALLKKGNKVKVIGFLFYKIQQDSFVVRNINIHPSYYNYGIAARLINRLKNKNSNSIEMIINEKHPLLKEKDKKNQFFLKSLGFQAKLVKNYFNKEDGIQFSWRNS